MHQVLKAPETPLVAHRFPNCTGCLCSIKIPPALCHITVLSVPEFQCAQSHSWNSLRLLAFPRTVTASNSLFIPSVGVVHGVDTFLLSMCFSVFNKTTVPCPAILSLPKIAHGDLVSDGKKIDGVIFLIVGTPRPEEGYRSYLCNEDTKKSRYAGERAGSCLGPLDVKLTLSRKLLKFFVANTTWSYFPL